MSVRNEKRDRSGFVVSEPITNDFLCFSGGGELISWGSAAPGELSPGPRLLSGSWEQAAAASRCAGLKAKRAEPLRHEVHRTPE